MANGDTKTEALLNILGNGGSGDEYKGCCNTKTQQYILDAIDRINNLSPGGGAIKTLTDADAKGEYEDVKYVELWTLPSGIYVKDANTDFTVAYALEEGEPLIMVAMDLPAIFLVYNSDNYIVSITQTADAIAYVATDGLGDIIEPLRSFGDIFTGTNGDDPGIVGLVPAPETADLGKFLSAEGYWKDLPDVSAVKTLTAADYNYPENAPEEIALWMLPVGQYVIDPNVKTMPTLDSSTINQGYKQGVLVLNQQADGAFYTTFILSNFSDDKYFKVQSNGNLVTGFPHDI